MQHVDACWCMLQFSNFPNPCRQSRSDCLEQSRRVLSAAHTSIIVALQIKDENVIVVALIQDGAVGGVKLLVSLMIEFGSCNCQCLDISKKAGFHDIHDILCFKCGTVDIFGTLRVSLCKVQVVLVQRRFALLAFFCWRLAELFTTYIGS